jgi:PAS domain S-box-containing protein
LFQHRACSCSGIDAVGDVPWGSHFCHFYETREDLVETLVSFFANGLENNEQCLWVAAEPLPAREAAVELARRVPDLAERTARGQIRIIDFSDWYTAGERLDAEALLAAWGDAEAAALAAGYEGLRLTGNVTFLRDRDAWREFERYEARVTEVLASRKIIGLCSYQLGSSGASDVLDVVRNHQFAVVRRDGAWEMLENVELKRTKAELHRLNAELELRVAARTAELADSERRLAELLDALPAAIYTTDATGRVSYFNQACIDLAGRRPTRDDQWCVTWRLYRPDGRFLPHDGYPMAVALKENRAVRGEEAIAERPGGERVPFLAFPTPLRDANGALVGAVNMLVDIKERKRAEELQRLLIDELNHRVKNTLASVQSIASHTFRATPQAAEATDAFEGRLIALSKAHDLLTRHQWTGVHLHDLVAQELAPYDGDGARTVTSGPAVTLTPNTAVSLGMALHELATNAAKYGAFANDSGRVEVRWALTPQESSTLLHLRWLELAGPPVLKPTRQGFGSRLIQRGLSRELNARVSLDYAASGVTCTFEIPLASVAAPVAPAGAAERGKMIDA